MPTQKILIISANPSTRLDIRELLRSDLYEIFEVGNLHEAVVYQRHVSPRVVFLDTGLPEGQALTFLEECPPDPTGPCEIIGFGKSDSLSEQDPYFKLGLNHILPLPFPPSRLRGVTRNAIKLRLTFEQLRAQAEPTPRSTNHDCTATLPETQHELLTSLNRNLHSPVNLLAHCTELLRQTHLSPQQLTWVTSIDGATHALSQIAQDMHQLREHPEASLSITPAPFNLHQLLDQYVQQQSPLAQHRGQEFTLEYAPDAPQTLLGDPRRLLQMTQSLFDYVLQLSPEGAFQLELQDRSFSNDGRIRLSLLCPASAPLLAPDTPQEFDPISTLPKGETLALCRHLAESMGGQMGATRQPNGGCQLWFELQLPLSSPPLQKAPPVVNPLSHTQPNKSVLLVEDDTLTTKLVRNLLEKLHCEVDVANNGREAVQKSSRRIYDAILLDYNLPLMNGMEVTRLIRANEARAQLNPAPVIILTGEARLDNTEACYQAGATAHLLKPFEFDDLAMTLHQAIMRAPSLHSQPQPQG